MNVKASTSSCILRTKFYSSSSNFFSSWNNYTNKQRTCVHTQNGTTSAWSVLKIQTCRLVEQFWQANLWASFCDNEFLVNFIFCWLSLFDFPLSTATLLQMLAANKAMITFRFIAADAIFQCVFVNLTLRKVSAEWIPAEWLVKLELKVLKGEVYIVG